MADQVEKNVTSSTRKPNVAAMQAGRAAATNARQLGPILSDRQKFMLSNVRQAVKACKLLIQRLQSGADISKEAASACNALSSEYVSIID